MKNLTFLDFILLSIVVVVAVEQSWAKSVDRIFVSELFHRKIEPQLFNWTAYGAQDQYQYRPSIKNYPDLPTWMRYMYSTEYYAGYLYGTPPISDAGREILIDVVGLNRQTYETKTITLAFRVISKNISAIQSVHMKIDNLNWVHLMDPGRVENLKNIFRNDLWIESKKDIHVMFMESAIHMGGRVPLRPQQKEGVIVHLASAAPFSAQLIDLQEEVKPLYKIASCSYKRTSVQTIFENAGFKMDWCAFRIVGGDDTIAKPHGSEKSISLRQGRWEPLSRADAPQRNYIDEIAFSVAIPGMILALLIAGLSAVLCLNNDTIDDDFKPLPEQSTEYSTPSVGASSAAAAAATNPIKPLKNLKDPTDQLIDDEQSLGSQSPCNSTYRIEGSPMSNSTLRPRPPPYKRSMVHKNGVQI